MDISIGQTLASLRKAKKLMQKDVAAKLSDHGFTVSAKTIYNWEKGLAQPGIPHFLALCDILDVDDALWRFAGISRGPYAGLNQSGRQKARELIDLLLHIDIYRTVANGYDVNNGPALANDSDVSFGPGAPDGSDSPPGPMELPRLLRLYDIPVSAGTGNFLDESGYELIEAPDYVPGAAGFALRIYGDSMEPLLQDGQIVWIREQKTLNNGEIGIFLYYNEVYCKKLIIDGGKAYLRSLNSVYDDIEIMDGFGFKTVGKVV